MIFVTVGTHHQGFPRLLSAVAGLPQLDQVVVQYGPGEPVPGAARAVAYMDFDEVVECFERASRVVTHAGVGSVLCARRAGHTPIVVPRQHALGEHVDDHQGELTRALATEGLVVPVWDTADLPAALDAAPTRRPPAEAAVSGLHGAVREALWS